MARTAPVLRKATPAADPFAELPAPPAAEFLCMAVGRLAAAAVARGDFAKAQQLIAKAADLAQVDAEVA